MLNHELDLTRIWTDWDTIRISRPGLSLMTHADVMALSERVVTSAPELARVEVVGHSVEKRDIRLMTIGRGACRVLLWSQMHGDEPTATGALFDTLAYLLANREATWGRRILDQLTLLVIPMLNPDGAARHERRNTQGIDINRDAQRLQTPEGRVLKRIRDQYLPEIGFNLHNQNARITVGGTRMITAIALLAPPYDPFDSTDASRLRAKRLATVMHDAVSQFVPAHVARYDDPFNPPAFGDAMTMWGTSAVLMESGGWAGTASESTLVKLNVVGLLAAFDALASGGVNAADSRVYEALPLNGQEGFHHLIRGATVLDGSGLPPIVADVGINVEREERDIDGVLTSWTTGGRIADYGDLQMFGGMVVEERPQAMITPGFIRPFPGPPLCEFLDAGAWHDEVKRGFTTTLATLPLRDSAFTGRMLRLAEHPFAGHIHVAVELETDQPDVELLCTLGDRLAAGARGVWILPRNPSLDGLARIGRIVGWFRGVLWLDITAAHLKRYVATMLPHCGHSGARCVIRVHDRLTDTPHTARLLASLDDPAVLIVGHADTAVTETTDHGFAPLCDDGATWLARLAPHISLDTLAGVVHRMTGRVASTLGLPDRGVIRKGRTPDLLVWNRTTDGPWRVETTLVNGERQ